MKQSVCLLWCGLSLAAALGLSACHCSRKTAATTPQNPAEAWYAAGTWRHGFKPDGYAELDVQQFYDQYRKQQPMYDSIFAWLAEIDPVAIPAGKAVMTWSHALANVQDLELRPLDKCKIEQHRKHIDLQWDVTGSERYGLVRDTTKLVAINAYKPDVQNFRCTQDFKMMDSDPAHFFLFFPTDYHQACGIANKPEIVRKIVVKIEYFE